jgi:hypothetical protein
MMCASGPSTRGTGPGEIGYRPGTFGFPPPLALRAEVSRKIPRPTKRLPSAAPASPELGSFAADKNLAGPRRLASPRRELRHGHNRAPVPGNGRRWDDRLCVLLRLAHGLGLKMRGGTGYVSAHVPWAGPCPAFRARRSSHRGRPLRRPYSRGYSRRITMRSDRQSSTSQSSTHCLATSIAAASLTDSK